MTRVSLTNMIVCDGCGVEITWAAVVLDGKMYCCQDCAEGRECECDYPPEESTAHEQQSALVAPAGYA